MQIGISSASLYPQLPTETAIVNIAALGCQTIEVFLQTRREYRPSYIRKLACLCTDLGMHIPSLHAASSQYEPMLFYAYKRQNLDGQDVLQRVLEAAAILGAQCQVFHGSLKVENPECSRILYGLHSVAEAAAGWGIKLALENVSWCAGWSPAVFRRLNQEKIPNLYYTFDSKQAVRSGFAAGDYLHAMGKRLVNVHVSDGMGGIPKPGGQDIFPLAKNLEEIGYSGPIILEAYGTKVTSTAQLAQGWRSVQRQFNK